MHTSRVRWFKKNQSGHQEFGFLLSQIGLIAYTHPLLLVLSSKCTQFDINCVFQIFSGLCYNSLFGSFNWAQRHSASRLQAAYKYKALIWQLTVYQAKRQHSHCSDMVLKESLVTRQASPRRKKSSQLNILLFCMCVDTHCYFGSFSAELPVCSWPVLIHRQIRSVLKQIFALYLAELQGFPDGLIFSNF